LLGQLRDSNAGKHFIHRAQVKFLVDLVRNLKILAGPAVCMLEQDGGIFGNEYRAGELIVCNKLFQVGPKVINDLIFVHTSSPLEHL